MKYLDFLSKLICRFTFTLVFSLPLVFVYPLVPDRITLAMYLLLAGFGWGLDFLLFSHGVARNMPNRPAGVFARGFFYLKAFTVDFSEDITRGQMATRGLLFTSILMLFASKGCALQDLRYELVLKHAESYYVYSGETRKYIGVLQELVRRGYEPARLILAGKGREVKISGLSMPPYSALAAVYSGGRSDAVNCTMAVQFLDAGVESGEAESAYLRGMMYQNGTCSPPDEAKSLALFTSAAAKGHVPSALRLGRMYGDGYGVEKSNDAAIKFYGIAAAQGSIDAYPAMVRLLHAEGNDAEARQWGMKLFEEFRNTIEKRAKLQKMHTSE